ncbi:MAG TPA: DsbC family protein, partial [Methylomicrobium sp.]|nr:DsbC family protein [Methylomicrobium sp.]
TVRYMFFPRAGKGSDSYKKAISVWCSDDRNAALTQAKKGTDPKEKSCKNPVDQHMQLAEDFEARGTPLIVTEKGTLLPGYVPAKQLAEILKDEQSGK